MLENIFLIGTHFPSWKVYIYVGSDVPEHFIHRMEVCSNVVIRRTEMTGAKNMIERFYAIDELDVDIMLVRDADSRVHWKDRWCIREFLKTNLVAHTIRDHAQHTAKIMGGLWGLRKSAGIRMKHEYQLYNEDMSLGSRHAHDQNFLGDVIYPKIVDRLLVHYSNGRVRLGESYAVEIPFDWSVHQFCGKQEGDYIEYPEPPRRPTPIGIQSLIKGPLPKLTNFLTTR